MSPAEQTTPTRTKEKTMAADRSWMKDMDTDTEGVPAYGAYPSPTPDETFDEDVADVVRMLETDRGSRSRELLAKRADSLVRNQGLFLVNQNTMYDQLLNDVGGYLSAVDDNAAQLSVEGLRARSQTERQELSKGLSSAVVTLAEHGVEMSPQTVETLREADHDSTIIFALREVETMLYDPQAREVDFSKVVADVLGHEGPNALRELDAPTTSRGPNGPEPLGQIAARTVTQIAAGPVETGRRRTRPAPPAAPTTTEPDFEL